MSDAALPSTNASAAVLFAPTTSEIVVTSLTSRARVVEKSKTAKTAHASVTAMPLVTITDPVSFFASDRRPIQVCSLLPMVVPHDLRQAQQPGAEVDVRLLHGVDVDCESHVAGVHEQFDHAARLRESIRVADGQDGPPAHGVENRGEVSNLG